MKEFCLWMMTFTLIFIGSTLHDVASSLKKLTSPPEWAYQMYCEDTMVIVQKGDRIVDSFPVTDTTSQLGKLWWLDNQ